MAKTNGGWRAAPTIMALVATGMIAATLAQAATTALDGDTLEYDGIKVQLWGIEAPDKDQTCTDGWPAGKMAAEHLATLVANHKVVCETKTTAAATPVYAVCKVDGRDLSEAMVADGMAWADLKQSPEYSVGEAKAMVDLAGVHAHRCLKAQEWRASHGGR